MPAQTHFETEIADVIVTSLNLEIKPGEIVPGERLFIEGLGLDSIDALELSLVLSQQYGIEIRSDDERIEEIFGSLSALASFVEQNRKH